MEHRRYGYDYIRIVACFMVLVNHTISSTIWGFTGAFSASAFVGNFLFSACKMDVVSFVLLSGALLLGKQESMKDWLVKRVLRIVLVILIFSALYYDWSTGNIGDYLYSIATASQTNAFWYLYLYLGLMICLPILRKLCQVLETKDYLLILGIFVVTQGIYPVLEHYAGFPALQVSFAGMFSYWISWVAVFLLGQFFDKLLCEKKFEKQGKWFAILLAGWLVGNLIPTVINYVEMRKYQDTSLFTDNFFLIWSFGATLCIDGMLLLLADKLSKKQRLNRIIQWISGLTFGIYLLGDKLITIFYELFERWSFQPVLRILMIDVLIFVVGGCITAPYTVLKKALRRSMVKAVETAAEDAA